VTTDTIITAGFTGPSFASCDNNNNGVNNNNNDDDNYNNAAPERLNRTSAA